MILPRSERYRDNTATSLKCGSLSSLQKGQFLATLIIFLLSGGIFIRKEYRPLLPRQ